jgi:hypothetical protein
VLVVGAIDAGDAQADRRWRHALTLQRGLHHRVEHFLEGQLAGALEVRAGLARPGQDRSVFVREQANRFGAADVDAENMHSRYITVQ